MKIMWFYETNNNDDDDIKILVIYGTCLFIKFFILFYFCVLLFGYD